MEYTLYHLHSYCISRFSFEKRLQLNLQVMAQKLLDIKVQECLQLLCGYSFCNLELWLMKTSWVAENSLGAIEYSILKLSHSLTWCNYVLTLTLISTWSISYIFYSIAIVITSFQWLQPSQIKMHDKELMTQIETAKMTKPILCQNILNLLPWLNTFLLSKNL